jgi:two-component system, chemotaxis family, protein-glutamate methylesterase/glutaminase
VVDVPLVVVGASAGGVEALRALVAGLPPDLDAAVLVVLHIPRTGPSALPSILRRAGRLPASHPADGEILKPGHIYVAPADHHLLVLDGRVRLSRGPTENGHRPAIDPLFRSAARAAGPDTVGVVLSGTRDDGTAGAAVIVERGGLLLAQDPEEAMYPSMPRSVLEHVTAVRVAPAVALGPAVAEAVRGRRVDPPPEQPNSPVPDLVALETAMADLEDLTTGELPAEPAGLACPTCHGALFQMPGDPSPRYRCWVGHAWSPESLLEEQTSAFEGALWMALRSLEEKTSLARRMDTAAAQRGSPAAAARFRRVADESESASGLIRDLIRHLGDLNGQPADAAPAN